MSTFNRFEKLRATDQPVAFTMHDIAMGGEPPVLLVLPATEANRPYINELLRSRTATAAARKQITAKTLEQARLDDVELFAKHVVKGWKHVVDDDGKPVVFSVEECTNFLLALARHAPDQFDKIRAFCNAIENFRPESMDVEAAAKN